MRAEVLAFERKTEKPDTVELYRTDMVLTDNKLYTILHSVYKEDEDQISLVFFKYPDKPLPATIFYTANVVSYQTQSLGDFQRSELDEAYEALSEKAVCGEPGTAMEIFIREEHRDVPDGNVSEKV